ncbi:hypothetical protein [Anatilimnocola floriformis]|uniref:hypothetical protein n=1 Tax=Anatilimnocola floriformis TaxID=2948575 RepID=UPI0020C42C7E|nr:hypothetical protein [Anatilimnocola floriformis]
MSRFGIQRTLWLLVVLGLAGSALSAEPTPLEKVLTKKISFNAGTGAKEFAFRDLADDVQKFEPTFAIEIRDKDFLNEGFTRVNHRLERRYVDQTVAEILTALVLRENPIPKVKPHDPDQKIVWVIAADPADPAKQIILITTRAAAKKRGDKLPEVFERSPTVEP